MAAPPKAIATSLSTPRRLNPKQFLRNGLAPSAALDTQLAVRINHAVRHKRKLLFMHGISNLDLPSGSIGTTERLRFRFLTGVGAVGIRIRALVMAKGTSSSAAAGLVLALKNVSAGTTVTTTLDTPNVKTAAYGVNELALIDEVIVCLAKTVYELVVSDREYARVMSISGIDVAKVPSDDESFYLSETTSVDAPILAARSAKMRDTINDLYTFGGPQLISLSRHIGADTITTSSTSYVRVLPANSDYQFNLTNTARRNKATVPVVIGVYGTVTGAGPGVVALYQGATLKASINVTANDTWFTTTANLDAADLGYNIRFKKDLPGLTFSIKSFFCYVYDP